MAALTSILWFPLLRTSPTLQQSFNALRKDLSKNSLASFQYHGYIIPKEGFPARTVEDEIVWAIQWSDKSKQSQRAQIRSHLQKLLGQEKRISELRFWFTETKDGGLKKAFESPVTQFAIINLHTTAPRSQPDLEASMHKTFTDRYFADGFGGGGWGYALNSNDASSETFVAEAGSKESELEEHERRLAFYPLGWESLEKHHAYAKTDLFDEEIDKLKPWFGEGTGAFYVKFEGDK